MAAATAVTRPLRYELVLVVLVSIAALAPGIGSYSLVDPWETHYGEVAREMLQDNDFVHTKWTGCYMCEPNENEGFRSKPVLMFWMMAAGLSATGVAGDGGYSGELVASGATMVGIRLPFVLSAIAGLVLLWWMLARLVSRRLAWLALLVVGTAPMFCMIARTAIPDMPMVACTIGALALFVLAVEDGDRAPSLRARRAVFGLLGAAVVAQAIYYLIYFVHSPRALTGGLTPAVWLPAGMLLLLGAQSRDGWLVLRLPALLAGGIVAAIVDEPMPRRGPGQTWWRHLCDDVFGPWDRHALDRYAIRVLPAVSAGGLVAAHLLVPLPLAVSALWVIATLALAAVWWRAIHRGGWAATGEIAERLLAMAPISSMRQLYFVGMYALLGVSLLAKGPPGMTVIAAVAALHVVLLGRWRALWHGAYELKRGLLAIAAVGVPWHLAMHARAGRAFLNEYLYTHILNRASTGVDNSPGTFEHYTSQLGHGMWLWAALLPAALGAAMLRARMDTREGRVRFIATLWAIAAVALFCLVTTKFHHYILPAVPPLALLVAFFLDDVLARRDRLHPMFAAIAIGIALLVTRDLMFEPERWIEMFVFRYDRPWPTAEPYAIDPSDGFLGLGALAAAGVAVMATRFARTGVVLTCLAGLAIALWSLHVYMPRAGTHWGMREAARTYYEQRSIYGQHLAYFGMAQLHDEWHGRGDDWSFETFIPETLHLGQPMTLRIQVFRPADERIVEKEVTLAGAVTAIGAHRVTLRLAPGERAKLEPLLAEGKRQIAAENKSKDPIRGRRPIHMVDADRLLAWMLYWRGELFWSGGEIWSWHPEMKTYFGNPNNVQFQKYLGDRARAPLGRRYFVLTEHGRLNSVKSLLPTERARTSYEILDQTSNKFGIGAFYL